MLVFSFRPPGVVRGPGGGRSRDGPDGLGHGGGDPPGMRGAYDGQPAAVLPERDRQVQDGHLARGRLRARVAELAGSRPANPRLATTAHCWSPVCWLRIVQVAPGARVAAV